MDSGSCRGVNSGCGGGFSIFAFVEGSGENAFEGFPFLSGGLFSEFELDFGAEDSRGRCSRVDRGEERIKIVLEVRGVGEGETDGDL